MASALFDNTRNLSLYAIPAAWVVAFLPHAWAASQTKVFDNRAPRTYAAALEKDQIITQAKREQILRAEAAQTNGFENLPLFSTAILAGNLASLAPSTLNTLAAVYLTSRVVYNYIYITNTSEAMANARSVVFLSGVFTCFGLFITAGKRLGSGAANLL